MALDLAIFSTSVARETPLLYIVSKTSYSKQELIGLSRFSRKIRKFSNIENRPVLFSLKRRARPAISRGPRVERGGSTTGKRGGGYGSRKRLATTTAFRNIAHPTLRASRASLLRHPLARIAPRQHWFLPGDVGECSYFAC
jgi:hypothetical protein